MSKFVKLPETGIVIDVETIAFVARADLNKFHVFLKVPTAAIPTIEGRDAEALEKAIGTEVLKAAPLVEAANKA